MLWPCLALALLSLPASSPSAQVQEMSRRIRDGVSLADLNMSRQDEEWGVYLLFGDERNESEV